MDYLSANYLQIRDEFSLFLSSNKGGLSSSYSHYTNNGGWKTVPLVFFTLKHPVFCGFFPKTMELVKDVPELLGVEFSVLQPNTIVKPHEGYSKEVMRSHLGLKVPFGDLALKVGEQQKKWIEGAFLSFNDGEFHEAWNKSNDERWVLMIDTPIPGSNYSAFDIAKYKLEHLTDPVLLNIAPKSTWLEVFYNTHT